MKWDDLKIFLSVARRKKLADAATELKIDITTISRRIKRLEDDLGQTLFERMRSGHQLTAHGEKLLVTAEQVETGIEKISRPNKRSAQTPSGTIRVSVAEGFGTELLAPILGRFKSQFPNIEIDLVSGSGFLSLSKREADIAIGLTPSKSKHITSELLKTYQLHLYAHPDYLKAHDKINALDDLQAHTLIDYVDDLIYSDELRYFERFLPNYRPEIRSTSIMVQKKLVESQAGIAILPSFLVGPTLTKILPSDITIKRQFWFSYHQSVAPLGKVKVFKQFCQNYLG